MAKQRRASSRPVRPKPADAALSVETADPRRARAGTAKLLRLRHCPAQATSKRSHSTKKGLRRSRRTNTRARPRCCGRSSRATPRRESFTSGSGSTSTSASATWRRAPRRRPHPKSGCLPPRWPSTPANYDEALEHLRTASAESPEHDHALYMLASVLTLRDQVDEAVPVLLRAIELNPDNRVARAPRPRPRSRCASSTASARRSKRRLRRRPTAMNRRKAARRR